MTTPSSRPDRQAIHRAARRFTQALAAEALLDAIARLEARLVDDGAGVLFALDEALADAWPKGEGALPRHEVIWATAGAEAGDDIHFSAFDASGRVLMRRSYNAASERKAAGHV